MPEVRDRYERISDNFSRLLEAAPEERWSSPSPCPDWSARDVAVHVIGMQRRVVANLEETAAADVDAEGDLLAQWLDARSVVLEALADPQRASKTIGGMFGDMTFEQLAGNLVCADLIIHSWDFAQATGQEDRLDPEGVAAANAALGPLDDSLRVPGGFGAKIEPAPGADERTRLLNFAGRRP